MNGLVRLVRRYGFRDGWFLWSQQRSLAGRQGMEAALDRLSPAFRVHHGEKPRFAGYRRRR